MKDDVHQTLCSLYSLDFSEFLSTLNWQLLSWKECQRNIVCRWTSKHVTWISFRNHNQSSRACPPAIVTMQHQGWSRARSPWFDTTLLLQSLEQRLSAPRGSLRSSWAQLFPDPDPQPWRCPAPHRGFSSRELQSQTEATLGKRVLLGLQHNLSIALTFEALQTHELLCMHLTFVPQGSLYAIA